MIHIMPLIRNDFRTKVERTLIFIALLQFVVTISVLFFFTDMYFNKYGEYSTDKEEVMLREEPSYVASRDPS